MKWHVDRLGGSEVPNGAATLFLGGEMVSAGTFTKVEAFRPRQLAFDLFWTTPVARYFWGSRWTSRMRGLYFEVRPDCPISLIGRGAWDRMNAISAAHCYERHPNAPTSLPSYTELITASLPFTTVYRGTTLFISIFQVRS